MADSQAEPPWRAGPGMHWQPTDCRKYHSAQPSGCTKGATLGHVVPAYRAQYPGTTRPNRRAAAQIKATRGMHIPIPGYLIPAGGTR
eukprot:3681862-Rhodomonas_salina.1